MKTIGKVLWYGAGIITWFIMMSSMYQWWGGLGLLGGFVFVPGVVLFPFIYWLVEGAFPIMYFVIWAIGVFGFIISSFSGEGQK
jgi:hypothetical protein